MCPFSLVRRISFGLANVSACFSAHLTFDNGISSTTVVSRNVKEIKNVLGYSDYMFFTQNSKKFRALCSEVFDSFFIFLEISIWNKKKRENRRNKQIQNSQKPSNRKEV